MNNGDIYCNGVNAFTGDYLGPPLSLAAAAALARRSLPDPGTCRVVIGVGGGEKAIGRLELPIVAGK